MKTKTVLFIVLGIVVLLAIGLLVFKKNPADDLQPGTSSSVTPVTDTTTTTGTKTATAPAVIHLNGGSHGTTTQLVVGQKMVVSLALPIDAGYMLDPLQYDSSVLNLVQSPQGTVTPGESVTWEFVALKSGTTGITITTTQGGNAKTTKTLFTNAVSVK